MPEEQMMESLDRLKEIAANPEAYARQWKKDHDGKVVGSFCSYAPEEIILASGALGFRIFGSDLPVSKADAHLQSYCCSLVRNALEAQLSGNLDFLDGVVFPHTCDSIQRLSDIWRINVTTGFHTDMVLPVKLDTVSARDYMADVVKKFRRDLENGLGKRISDTEIEAAADLCNQIRRTVRSINKLRIDHPGLLSGKDAGAMAKAGMVMDRHEFLELVRELAMEMEQKRPDTRFSGKRIVLSGGLCNMPDVYSIIEESGSAIVSDDLCTGSRFFDGDIAHQEDVLGAVADRYTARQICPAKHSGLYRRGEQLIKQVKESRADGVIFVYLKFCDPHSFDYPYLKEMLDQHRIPCLLYEMEAQMGAGGQFRTRCEAFLEMV